MEPGPGWLVRITVSYGIAYPDYFDDVICHIFRLQTTEHDGTDPIRKYRHVQRFYHDNKQILLF